MKKLLALLIPLLFTSCMCVFSQIPPQTIYADQNCQGAIPDFSTRVVASDNCVGTITIQQYPAAGSLLTASNPAVTVTITAKDMFGNISKPLNVSVILVDTIAPILQFPVGRVNMNEKAMIDLYRNWEAAVKIHGAAKWVYDQRWAQGFTFADSAKIINSLRFFTNVIELTEEEYDQYVSYVESNK